jgi:predicted deacetylase
MTAKYLVRIDDVCPTMDWGVWRKVETILLQHRIKPLLAVVPDNKDDFLKRCSPAESFWTEVRVWQSRGWTIGLHGYQHQYVTENPGIMEINKKSEFAGLAKDAQAGKIQMALAIFRREGIQPDVWVAPAHSFDSVTLDLLTEAGVRRISDGFFLYPNLDSRGMFWIPQQLWRFRPLPFGVWTVCLHINGWGPEDLKRFERAIKEYRTQIVSFDYAITFHGQRRRDWKDKVVQAIYTPLLHCRLRLRFSPTRVSPRAPEPDQPKHHSNYPRLLSKR